MTEINKNPNLTPLLFADISRRCTSSINDAIQRAILCAAVDLYKTLESTEDWLRSDYSLSINLLESNDEWFAAQVSSGIQEALKQSAEIKLQDSSELDQKDNTLELKKQKIDLNELSLVSKDAFEDWLTASVGVKFLEAELAYELNDTVLVLGALVGKVLDEKTCAIGPDKIFSYLKASIDKLEVPPSPQAIIYKTIARSLVADLKELYGFIVREAQKAELDYKKPVPRSIDEPVRRVAAQAETPPDLIDGSNALVGDLPDSLASSSSQAVGAQGSASLNVNSAQVPGNTYSPENKYSPDNDYSASVVLNGELSDELINLETNSEIGSGGPTLTSVNSLQNSTSNVVHMETLDTLSRLNASVASGGSLHVSNSAGEGDNAGKYRQYDAPLSSAQAVSYNPTELVGAISQLQQIHGDKETNDRRNLRSWIETGLSDIPGVQCEIGNKESELIDVTDRFFEVIVEKIGVSGLLKKWLEKLKLTILKVVLRDKNFFSDVSHPARQMINKLAKLASSDRADHKRLEKVLDRFIDRVVTEYDDDEHAVEKILEELNKMLERQAQAHKRNSDRIARAYEGKQKVADARHQVVIDLNKLLGGKSVPVVLLELLDKAGWREHLSLVSVRDGRDSESYKEVLNVVDLLLNWLGEEADSTEKWALDLEMELEAPSLLELITKELSVVGLIGYESVLIRLQDCLFSDVDPLLVKVQEYDWPYDKSEKDISDLRPGQNSDSLMSHWHKRIVSMKVGDWVEVKDESGRTRCLRLAWSGSESFRFVFVDSQGMKDEDVTLDDLVAMFKDNRACFVDNADVPLVDQGLHQMVQSVYEELASQSSCDVLTGLLNRQAFERALEQSIVGAVTNNGKAALIYIDLDKFSLTNSSYGHHAGDALLQHVAGVIKNQSQEDAFCGRLGGNEFGVILSGCSLEKTTEIATNICKEVESETYVWEEHNITSTVSLGVANFEVETDSYDTVMRKAGQACELAKSLGRNRAVVYQEQDQDQKKRDEMLQWVQRLDGDLDELLTLRCQEIRPVNFVGESRVHYEVLLGVKLSGQVLPPGMLIEAAEHFGRMARVDRWVVHNVLRWMEDHESIVAMSDGFSINLSGNSLSDDTFLEFILGQFAASTVSPELICFEITETAAITNLADATEFIRVLKQTGCKFSLDDFGSGLSSYAYIQKLPVDFIKIDGIFIRNIAENEQDQALVKSINELAHFMGMKTVAEYVENHDILAVLKTIGVDHSQGFGIKKPGLLADLVKG